MEVRQADCPLGAKCEEVQEVDGNQAILRCPWYQNVQGQHPQTGERIDHWACAIALLPMLLIENAQESRQGAAATESLRNEIVRRANQARLRQSMAQRVAHAEE